MVSPRLSVHDTSPVWRGSGAATALRESVELARAVEQLGFHRYWLAEHHATPALASSAPAVLAGQVLTATSSLRVGSGAVLLPSHSPLVVAEQFLTLAALHSARVDLGIGRGKGGSPESAARLGQSRSQTFDEQLDELTAYLADAGPVRATPRAEVAPELVIVGNSVQSAELAGRRGLPYVYAEIIRPGFAAEALAAYREAFSAGPIDEPYAGVAINAVVADSDDLANRLARPFVVGQLAMRSHDPHTLLPTLQETDDLMLSDVEESFVAEKLAPSIIGSRATVAKRLATLIEAVAPDELFVLTQVPGIEHRRRSYELLAEIVR
ncbi:LLM class flavin-dependent oxidoreductase [Aeromicrobium alkaliterrae]|uniref:LLM class flavin-dependent oxidoreductase n=1 Tax=Aeromicrobium alkaliterrae TaxID=302168 RepID=A0ABN2K8X4_9ACTN